MTDSLPSKDRLAELIDDRQRFVTFLEAGGGDPDLGDALGMARDTVAALKRLAEEVRRLSQPPRAFLTDQERHALWNAVESARNGFAWTDPTGRRLLAELYERTAETKPAQCVCGVPEQRGVVHRADGPCYIAGETSTTLCRHCEHPKVIGGCGWQSCPHK